jgi:hypothetical protein
MTIATPSANRTVAIRLFMSPRSTPLGALAPRGSSDHAPKK